MTPDDIRAEFCGVEIGPHPIQEYVFSSEPAPTIVIPLFADSEHDLSLRKKLAEGTLVGELISFLGVGDEALLARYRINRAERQVDSRTPSEARWLFWFEC